MASTQDQKMKLNQAIVKNYHQQGRAKIAEACDLINEASKNLVERVKNEKGESVVTGIKQLIEHYFLKLHRSVSVKESDFFKSFKEAEAVNGDTESEPIEEDKGVNQLDHIMVQKLLNKPKIDSNHDIADSVSRSRLRFDPDLNPFQLQLLKITSGKSRATVYSSATLKNGVLLISDWAGTVHLVKEEGNSYSSTELSFTFANRPDQMAEATRKSNQVRADYLRPCSTGCLILEKEKSLLFAQPHRGAGSSNFRAVELFKASQQSHVVKFYSVHESDEDFEGLDLIHVFALIKDGDKLIIKLQVLQRDAQGFNYQLRDKQETIVQEEVPFVSALALQASNYQFMHQYQDGKLYVLFAFREEEELVVRILRPVKDDLEPEQRFGEHGQLISSQYLEELGKWVFVTRSPERQFSQNTFSFIEVDTKIVARTRTRNRQPALVTYSISDAQPFRQGFQFDEADKSVVKTGGVSAVHILDEKPERSAGSADHTRRFMIFTESGFYTSGSYCPPATAAPTTSKKTQQGTETTLRPSTNHALAAHHQVSDCYAHDGVFRAVFMPRPWTHALADEARREAQSSSILLSYRFGQHSEDN